MTNSIDRVESYDNFIATRKQSSYGLTLAIIHLIRILKNGELGRK